MDHSDSKSDAPDLKGIVRKWQVFYEVLPAITYVDSLRRQIGYDVTLYGTHGEETGHVDPGCAHCIVVWNDLKRIADSVVPCESRPSVSRVEPFDHMLHQSKSRRYRNDVELVISVRHRSDYEDPLDACESTCLGEIVRNLKALGIAEQSWSDLRSRWMGV